MLENIRLSLQGIWSHKLRSMLTMLGIIIGIASIISIVSTIQGTNEQIKQNLIGAGNNSIRVELYQGDETYYFDWQAAPKGVPEVSDEVKQQIAELPEVEDVALYKSRSYTDQFFYNDKKQTARVYGIENNYFDVKGYVVRTGRGFTDDDLKNFRKVIILDQTIASGLFQEENPLGKTVELGGHPFVVIGIAQQRDEFQPTINNIDDYWEYVGYESGGAIYIPESVWPIVYQYDEPQNLEVKAVSTDAMSNAGKKAAEILNQTLSVDNTDIKYKGRDVLATDSAKEKLSQSTNIQLIWIASISLLVGGIGVMNIMLVTVTERTSEIGLKKAIGAKKKSILGQFLTEAAVLTSLGGIIGVIAGIVLAEVISRVADIPVGISIPAIIISVIFSMLIGIVFGLLPSIQAANLNPIDALRRE